MPDRARRLVALFPPTSSSTCAVTLDVVEGFHFTRKGTNFFDLECYPGPHSSFPWYFQSLGPKFCTDWSKNCRPYRRPDQGGNLAVWLRTRDTLTVTRGSTNRQPRTRIARLLQNLKNMYSTYMVRKTHTNFDLVTQNTRKETQNTELFQKYKF